LLEVLGKWHIDADEGAPSAPNVFRQGRGYLDADAPRVLLQGVVVLGMTASVKLRPEAGERARGGGIVFQAQSVEDYLLAYADTLHGVLTLSEVEGGDEHEVARAPIEPASGGWHELMVMASTAGIGDGLAVAWDHKTLVTTRYDGRPGRIGLSTKGDAVTSFDDLDVVAQVEGPYLQVEPVWEEQVISRR
jgi:hypothetical protein